MRIFIARAVVLACIVGFGISAAEAACTPTGFNGLTAALVNPGPVTGSVDAKGCDIGVYINTGCATISDAQIWGALWFGVLVNGDASHVTVNVENTWIHHIGDSPFNGSQRGIGIYYRAFLGSSGSATGRISGNTIEQYQKGGIVTNGAGTTVQILDNTVTGLGPVNSIAQNGIQVGYGADASVMRNSVEGHSYTGTSTVSGGIIAVGGPGYGSCPDGKPCPYTRGTRIVQNKLINNDVGIFLTNLDATGSAPATATNIKATNNAISNSTLQNNYGGIGYQAGVSDVGNNDKVVANQISGAGYDPKAYPSAYVVTVDADPSFTSQAKVHANR